MESCSSPERKYLWTGEVRERTLKCSAVPAATSLDPGSAFVEKRAVGGGNVGAAEARGPQGSHVSIPIAASLQLQVRAVARVGELSLRGIRVFPFEIELVLRDGGKPDCLPLRVLPLVRRNKEGEVFLPRQERHKADASEQKLFRLGVVQESVVVEMDHELSVAGDERRYGPVGKDRSVVVVRELQRAGGVRVNRGHARAVHRAVQCVTEECHVSHPGLHRPGKRRDLRRSVGGSNGLEHRRYKLVPGGAGVAGASRRPGSARAEGKHEAGSKGRNETRRHQDAEGSSA